MRELLLILVAAHLMEMCRSLSNDILGLDIPTEPPLDANTVCKTYPGLSTPQYELCSKFPDVAASAIQGIQISVHECQHQFKSHRWNCSTLETKNKNPHSSPILHRGYKETAFAYAISAAGMVTQVSRACSLGKLKACGCRRFLDEPSGQWFWRGCENNVAFGDWFTKKFLDSKERAKDVHSQMNNHNNRAGRLIVRQNVKRMCKCHGVSGSCEIETCWNVAPQFRIIGNMLKEKYNRATKVKVSNSNSAKNRLYPANVKGRRRRHRRRARIHRTNLAYFEKSPNFCDFDAEVNFPGTAGRYCNKTSKAIDNCETLCCGRGYNTLRVTRTERCHCRFHWCCYVVCKNCTFTQWVTVCK